jgi:endonuclease-3
MHIKSINALFRTLEAANPAPVTELCFVNNYTLLVAVVLSAQATDKGVNKATAKLFSIVTTPEQMLALGEEGLKSHIKTIGLFNSKAKNILLLSQQLIEKHGSTVPEDLEALQALPGVGRKTANVVLNCAFGKPTMAVDTHVLRVANRLGLAASKNPLQVEKQLLAAIPKRWLQHAHHWLILHGRYICKARAPQCSVCPIERFCPKIY